MGAYALVYDDHSKVNALCGAGDALDKRMCLEGLFGGINTLESNTDVSKSICENYTALSKAECLAVASLGNFSMKRDFAPYLEAMPVKKP